MASPNERSAGHEGDAAQTPTAAWHWPSHLRLWLVAVVGLFLDLWTKHLAFTRLSGDWNDTGLVAIPGLMSFRRSLNPGALFGLGKGLTPLFIGASLLALGFVLYLFIHSSRKRWSLHIALALVLAGALGNLFDRAFMIADVVKFSVNGRRYTLVGKVISPEGKPIQLASWPDGTHRYPRVITQQADPEVRQLGVVRDFVKMEPHFQAFGYRIEMWPWVFNVADVLLVVGVGVLMLNFWRERKAERSTHKSESAESAPPEDAAAQV